MATTVMSPLDDGGGSTLEEDVVVGASCKAVVAASASRVAAESCSSSRRRVMARTRVGKYMPLELDDCIASMEVPTYKDNPLETLGQGAA
jgi:hypothetical protein